MANTLGNSNKTPDTQSGHVRDLDPSMPHTAFSRSGPPKKMGLKVLYESYGGIVGFVGNQFLGVCTL